MTDATPKQPDSPVSNDIRHIALRTFCITIIGAGLIAYLVIQQEANYVARDRDALRAHFEEYTMFLDGIFTRVVDHTEMLRASAEDHLFESRMTEACATTATGTAAGAETRTEASQERPCAPGPLAFPMIQGDETGYHLNDISAPLATATMGNLTGVGVFSGRDRDFYREVEMALHLNAGFHRAAKTLGNLAWVYYTSGHRFMNLYPWVASKDFHVSSVAEKIYDTRELEFYWRAMPEHNPERKVLWAKAYDDGAGKGVMTTCFAPVYDGERFVGTVSADLLVDFLNQVVERFVPERGGTMILVDHEGNLLAYPDKVTSGDREVTKVGDGLPSSLAARLDEIHALGNSQLGIMGEWAVLTSKLEHAPFRIYYIEPIPPSVTSFINRVGVSVVVALLLMFGVILAAVTVNVRRTVQLTRSNRMLAEEIVERTRLEQEEKRLSRELADVSRRAGMAEIASNVLHNVGNVLNSITVSSSQVKRIVDRSKLDIFDKSLALMKEQGDGLGAWIASDEKGRMMPRMLDAIGEAWHQEHSELGGEAQRLLESVDHIRAIISRQQEYASIRGVSELVSLEEVVNDAVKMNAARFERHAVTVHVDAEHAPPAFPVLKHKVVQILINLLNNAVYACDAIEDRERRIDITVRSAGADHSEIEVADNGAGIEPENLEKIFTHGFTTRESGHGFGLHDCANLAQQMGGALSVTSDGPDKGARFVLCLPHEHT